MIKENKKKKKGANKMEQLVKKYQKKGKKLGISFHMDVQEQNLSLEHVSENGRRLLLGGNIHTFSTYVFLNLYGEGLFEKNNKHSQTLIQFFMSFWKEWFQGKNKSFSIIETGIFDFKFLSSLSPLKESEELKPLLGVLDMDNVYTLYGFEKEEGSIEKYLRYFLSIIESLKNLEKKYELFSYYTNYQKFKIESITFTFCDDWDDLEIKIDKNHIKPIIFSQKGNNGKEKVYEVEYEKISHFFETLLEKKQQSLRLKYLSNPPRNQFNHFIKKFRVFKRTSPIPDSLHQKFMEIFKGDYLKIEIMAKTLLAEKDSLTTYQLKKDRIVYFTFEEQCFVIGFYEKSDQKYLFKHVPIDEAEEAIKELTYLFISNHIKKEQKQ